MFTWASINPEYPPPWNTETPHGTRKPPLPPPMEHENPVHPSVAQLHICIHLCMGRVQNQHSENSSGRGTQPNRKVQLLKKTKGQKINKGRAQCQKTVQLDGISASTY
jgi:hypothetical protein